MGSRASLGSPKRLAGPQTSSSAPTPLGLLTRFAPCCPGRTSHAPSAARHRRLPSYPPQFPLALISLFIKKKKITSRMNFVRPLKPFVDGDGARRVTGGRKVGLGIRICKTGGRPPRARGHHGPALPSRLGRGQAAAPDLSSRLESGRKSAQHPNKHAEGGKMRLVPPGCGGREALSHPTQQSVLLPTDLDASRVPSPQTHATEAAWLSGC